MLAPLLALWTMQAPVAVHGDSTCPRASEVESRLAELMAKVPDDVVQDRAVLSQDLAGLHVDLFRDDGVRIAERRLAPSSGCADLAAAAAVIIATWEAQLRPQRLGRVALPGPSGMPASPAASAIDVEVGGFGSLADGAWEPGVLIAGSWAPERRPLGIYLAVSGADMRWASVVGVPGGKIGWTRDSLLLGPRYRLKGALARVDVHAGALGGLLQIETSGLTSNGSDTVGALGVGAGVHAYPAWSVVAPWIGVDAQFWPTRESLQVAGLGPQTVVPRFDLHLAAGIGFGRF